MEPETHPQLHVFFFPLMGHGHMLPMFDIARLFAAHGVKSTIVTTPFNASVFSSTVDRERRCGRDINLQTIRFPSTEVGLPEGCESLHSLTSAEMGANFVKATTMLQQPLEQLLVEYHPDCIVADMFFPWATDIAGKLGIPRLVFHGTGFFALCATNIVDLATNISTDREKVLVLDSLPHKIEMKKSQLPDHVLVPNNPLLDFFRRIRESEWRSYGVVVNSFLELEPAYAEHYRKVLGRKAWHIGPVSLFCNRNTVDKAQRGQKPKIDEYYCMNWLDEKEPNTVLYVCFGSICWFTRAQMLEIAMALEASGFPFIWVIRTFKEGEEQCLPEGFVERIKGKGLIIKDWAPQLLILDHPATGGFMTHCGWNSILEGLSAGLPMITWPLFAEQFYNEKLVTQVARVGIQVGAETWNSWMEIRNTPVKRDVIEKVVNRLMGSGEEALEIRERAKVLGQMAKKAVEDGGSSYSDFTALIEELSACKQYPSDVSFE